MSRARTSALQTIDVSSSKTSRRRTGRRPGRVLAAEGDARTLLIDAARNLFAEQGYAATSTRQIASISGLNISLIRYYFGTKEGLYKACLEAVRDAHLRTLSESFTPATSTTDVRDKIAIFVMKSLEIAAEHPSIGKMIHRSIQDDYRDRAFLDLLSTIVLGPAAVIAEFLASARDAGYVKFEDQPLALANIVSAYVSNAIIYDGLKETLVQTSIKTAAHRTALARVFANNFVGGMRP